jgi:histidine triad (HIT) family protein
MSSIAQNSASHDAPALTLFDRILSGEIPCKKVLENEHCLAFHDIAPQAPVHVLVIPKTKLVNVGHAQPDHAVVLGQVLLMAAEVARHLGVAQEGYRLVLNNGDAGGQTVHYLHCHVLAGRPMRWPPG